MTESYFVLDLPGVDSDALRMLATHCSEQYPFLLSSADAGEATDANDVLLLGSEDCLILSAVDGDLSLRGVGDGAPFAAETDDFCQALDAWHASEAVAETSDSLPFVGGWFVYLSYELAAQIEPSLALNAAQGQLVAMASRSRAAIVLSRAETRHAQLVSEYPCEALRTSILKDIDAVRATPRSAANAKMTSMKVTPDDAFIASVRDAKRAISEGEIYQANLSRQWDVGVPELSVGTLFDALCETNPSPFAALAHLGPLTILSSSPERLVSVKSGVVATRPIAGTRHRSADPLEDRRLVDELLQHPKERAEHIMLIDLERNDLGRICMPGSVTVDEYMTVESYQHVHHIVSNVTGVLQPATTPGQVIRAVFPGGTITGCPKVRCMQLIAELEARPRGAYTGSLGYLGRDGQMDLNILIRTMATTANTLTFSAGAGIVADSDADAELAETTAKATGLLRALESVVTCTG